MSNQYLGLGGSLRASKVQIFKQNSGVKKHLWLSILFVFIGYVCFYKAFKFQYRDFIFNYPFISYDGFQWISDSLHYLDRSIEITHRNPGLPLTFALLKILGLTDYYTYIIAALTTAFFGASYWLCRAFASPQVSRLTVLWFFFVFRIHNFFDYVLSDPWCLVFMTIGLAALARISENPRHLILAAASFGLSLNYQFAPGFASPALVWFLFRGPGKNWLLQHKKVVMTAILVFLTLALPQFIYKWIFFGSPLYSHVVHFPLLRMHLFGLPYYAVNIFSFLGWPLALVMLYGVRKTFYSRDPKWQLIHLYSLCMFLFWILNYLWLDVRFLLYFLPAWFAYTARGVDELRLLNWLSFKGKTPIHRAAIVVAIYFGVSLASMKFIAFESTVLPITPQTSLRFSAAPISEWGVSTLTTDKILTEHTDSWATLFNLSYHFKFYRGFARAQPPHSSEFIKDVKEMAELIASRSTSLDRVGLCGNLENVFETKMRIFDTVRRNLGPCSRGSKYLIFQKNEWNVPKNPQKIDFQEIFEGTELVLLVPKAQS